MGSSSKFPSGLNNWAGTDKPTREDFVLDNEILDENVLWKNAYDEEGAVAQAGGIPAYALPKTGYDPEGAVAQAGGIPSYALSREAYDPNNVIAQAGGIEAALNQVEGFSTYAHSKSGSIHSLISENGGVNMKFVATADYSGSDTFEVNGTACTAQTTDGGTLPDRIFAEGSVANCFLSGTVLNFKSGGAGLNFDVIGGLTQPSSPRENTMWIVTDSFITEWSISDPADPPVAAVEGHCWIRTDALSTVGVNALKKNRISLRPIEVVQRIGDDWIKKQAALYQDDEWKELDIYIWKDGNTYNHITGGYTVVQNTSKITIENNMIRIHAYSSGTQWAVNKYETAYPIDLTNIKTIQIERLPQSQTGSSTSLYANGTPLANVENAQLFATANIASSTVGVLRLNVSSLRGQYYIGIRGGAQLNTKQSSYLNNWKLIP